MNNFLSIQLKNDENNDSKNTIKLYEIKQLLNRRISSIDQINYLIKWKDYESQNNVYYSLCALKNFIKLMKKYDEKHSISKNISNKKRNNIKKKQC